MNNLTKDEAYNCLLKTYTQPLGWKFNYDILNRVVMYKKPNINFINTFIIFYKKYNLYYADIGYCFEYFESDHETIDSYGYFTEIMNTISLKNNEKLYPNIRDIFENMVHEGFVSFINDEEKNKFYDTVITF